MRLFLVLAGVIIFSNTYCQSQFKSVSNNGSLTSFKSVKQLSDGTYLCVGDLTSVGSFYASQFLVEHVDAVGGLLTSIVLAGITYAESNVVIATSDGGFMIAGAINQEMGLVKLDGRLQFLWAKTYTDGNNGGDIYDLHEEADGNFILSGTVANADIFSTACILRITSSGDLLMAKQYFGFSDGDNTIVGVVPTSDGNYALLAILSNSDDTKDSSCVIKVTPSGDALWGKYLQTDGTSNAGTHMINTFDHNLAFGGYIGKTFNVNGTSVPIGQMSICKMSENGALLWSKRIEGTSPIGGTSFSVMEQDDHGLVIAGLGTAYNNDLSAHSSYGAIVKLSSDGSLQSTATDNPGDSTVTIFMNATPALDGGFVITGSLEETTRQGTAPVNGLVYKYDANGNSCSPSGTFGQAVNTGSLADHPVASSPLTLTTGIVTLTSSQIGTVSTICSILPLNFISFTAQNTGSAVKLNWTTSKEQGIAKFIVERSGEGRHFSKIDSLPPGGQYQNVQDYLRTDNSPLPGMNFYRIEEVDLDGRSNYSTIINCNIAANDAFLIMPNPAYDKIRIQVGTSTPHYYEIAAFDEQGRKWLVQRIWCSNNTSNTLDISKLAKGLYFLQVIDVTGIQTIKFIKN